MCLMREQAVVDMEKLRPTERLGVDCRPHWSRARIGAAPLRFQAGAYASAQSTGIRCEIFSLSVCVLSPPSCGFIGLLNVSSH